MKITNRQIFKTTAIVGSTIVPAVYMTKFHTKYYNGQPKKKADMRNRMIGFFGGLVPGLWMIHKYAKTNMKKSGNFAMGMIGAGLSAVGGYWGLKLAKLYNQKVLWKPVTKPETFLSYGKVEPKKGLYKAF